MKLIEYARRRKAGFSHAAARAFLSQAHIGDTVIYTIACCVIVFFSLKTAAATIEQGQQDAADRATDIAAVTIDRLEKVVVSCLNNSVINVEGFAFTCKAESLEQKL